MSNKQSDKQWLDDYDAGMKKYHGRVFKNPHYAAIEEELNELEKQKQEEAMQASDDEFYNGGDNQ